MYEHFLYQAAGQVFSCELVPSAITPLKLETRPERISRLMTGSFRGFRRPSNSRFSTVNA